MHTYNKLYINFSIIQQLLIFILTASYNFLQLLTTPYSLQLLTSPYSLYTTLIAPYNSLQLLIPPYNALQLTAAPYREI